MESKFITQNVLDNNEWLKNFITYSKTQESYSLIIPLKCCINGLKNMRQLELALELLKSIGYIDKGIKLC